MNPRNIGDDFREFIGEFTIPWCCHVPVDAGISGGQNAEPQIEHGTVHGNRCQSKPSRPELPARCGAEGGVGGLVGKNPTIGQESGTNGRIKAGNRAYALKFGAIVVNGH
jgi:hypothetical protein